MHRLRQDPVDLLAQLDDVGRGDPILASLRHGEHVFVQRAPGGNEAKRFGSSTSSLALMSHVLTLERFAHQEREDLTF